MPIIERPFSLNIAFRDPVHDFIRVSEAERQVIDTQPVQRLRRIHQLGPGYLVYHGAEHSRFGHAIGTMEVASRIFEAIERKAPEALGESPPEIGRNWQLVRLAALLHDVGHAPFSHATEEIMPEDNSGRPYTHENYTTAIIRNEEELCQAISKNFDSLGITPDEVAALIDRPGDLGAQGVVLHQIISGELDGDRMDYLARDSLYAGASYGRFDLGRLLETVTVAKWQGNTPWFLAVEAGGIHALEQFLLARYYMYLQVYLHDGRRFFDYALNRYLQGILREGRYPPPETPYEYLEYDDSYVLQRARKEAKDNQWAQAIWCRSPWTTIDYTDPHPQGDDVRRWSLKQRQLEQEFPNEEIMFDDASGTFYSRMTLAPYSLGAAEEEGKYPILVVEEGKADGFPVEQRSMIVRNLSEPSIMLMRLYARKDIAGRVRERWASL